MNFLKRWKVFFLFLLFFVNSFLSNEIQAKEKKFYVKKEKIEFFDIYKRKYSTEIDQSLKMHPYHLKNFKKKGNKLFYQDKKYTSKLGVDVSHHQKNIDWKKVKHFGIEFAFIRIGARGYGKTGKLIADREYARNIREAKKQGIEVGVYFYSQALDQKEAKEEADFVLKLLQKETLDLPVIYDFEYFLTDNGKKNIGRNAKVSGKQATKNALTFFKTMEKEGYLCGLYADMLWQSTRYEMEKLKDYPIWYADYEKLPQSPYMFTFW